MKKAFTITLILLGCMTVMGQTKYYKTTVEFETVDGCFRTATNTNSFKNGYSANFEGTYAVMSKWIKPYKIKPHTFKITSIVRISKKDQIKKQERFEPCKNTSSYSTAGLLAFTSCDTCHYVLTGTSPTPLQSSFDLKPLSYTFTAGINGGVMLKIHIPENKFPIDSLIMYVKKSQIRWLNDSTAIIHKP